MVRHDFTCTTCDRSFEASIDVATLPAGPPCPTCGAATIRVFLPPQVTWNVDAVVVYRAPDGTFRYPGDPGGASCAKYEHLGYERIEARGFASARALERRLNATEASHMARMDERRQAQREHGDRIRGAELRRVMQQHMTDAGRHYATRVIALRDQVAAARARRTGRDPHRPGRDPGLHIEAYSMDRSNRDESRGTDGRRRRD
jgi:hypothetical protein